MNIDEIKAQAIKEIAEERFRQEVQAEKHRLQQYKPLWDRFFPWIITIRRKT